MPAAPHSVKTIETAADPRLQMLASIDVPLYLFDVDGVVVVWANRSALRYWEAESTAELFARDLKKNITATTKLRLKQLKEECFKFNRIIEEHWTLYPKSIPKSSDFRLSAFRAVGGQELLLMYVKNADAVADAQTEYRNTALMHTSTMISAFDKDLQIVYTNAAAKESIPANITTADKRIVHAQDLQDIVEQLRRVDHCDVQTQVNTTRGQRWHALHVQRCINPSTGRTMFLSTESDITDQRAAEREAYRLAFTDSLTSLPNRSALNSKLDEIIAGEPPVRFAVFFLDLDRFKIINDSLGHAVGDQLLIDVGQRLKSALGKEGMVARMGGDEFVMLLTDTVEHQDLKRIAEQILSTMENPVVVSGHRLRVLPSIGISVYPMDGGHISSVMENADAAMYIAKSTKSGFCFYDAKMSSSINENVKERMSLENDMVTAIANNEFELYFQPKIYCNGLSVSGVEALIRWHHRSRGLVEPDIFIGIAEETGQIIELGNWVLVAAMRQQRKWQDEGISVPVSINISSRQFSANDLLADVTHALAKTGCDPKMIELEITESILIDEPDTVNYTLQQLSAMGIRLALDDFGTGYSNLAYLQHYPLDCLKIDRQFLADRKRSMLMRTILNMGQILGLEVVAEGVETASQAEWLAANGCDQMQGFYFSKPSPVSQITQYLLENGAARCAINDKAA